MALQRGSAASLRIFEERFLANSKQFLSPFARGVGDQMPPRPRQYGGQTKIDRNGAAAEHQEE